MDAKRQIIHSQIGHTKINTDHRHDVKLIPEDEIEECVESSSGEL
jgi:hypothetical protein